MVARAYALFQTPLGVCGITWSESAGRGSSPHVISFHLPESTPAATERRIERTAGASRSKSPPRAIAEIIERVRQHLSGHIQDFRSVTVDLTSAGAFERRVYAAAREIPAGETRTYGEIARTLGRPGAARAVGQALGRNPIPLIIPCHRVLAAGSKPGGFSAPGGPATKLKLLEIERAPIAFLPLALSFDFDTQRPPARVPNCSLHREPLR
ncbi:MAG TPA: methylated-DNA--[protein]-cysteine S-methyltransferase [Terriglobia bacterium]|nr:methylated-DNA--[protein]-cysteine S-methyltransferase [Terriglobia bacterium]